MRCLIECAPCYFDSPGRALRGRSRAPREVPAWTSDNDSLQTANRHIAAGLIWASLCAAVLKRFLAHAAQLVGGKPISTRRVAMCASHIIHDIVNALLACASIASAFFDGMTFLLANARRANPKRDRKSGRLRTALVTVGVSS